MRIQTQALPSRSTVYRTGDKVAHDPSDPTHVVTFEVIFTYADGVTSDPTLESVLLFEFADAANWEEPGGGDEPGGDEPGGDEPGGGGSTVVAGEDFAALIETACGKRVPLWQVTQRSDPSEITTETAWRLSFPPSGRSESLTIKYNNGGAP